MYNDIYTIKGGLYQMAFEGERIKLTCEKCKKQYFLTFNTKQCPHCRNKFDEDDVHNIFYKRESIRANSKTYQTFNKIEKTGDTMQDVGKGFSELGCALTLIGIIFVLILLFV